ncbi:MAG: MmgE/PrpD family protein [Acetobacteraceae bacterium]|nr:MmgE/PrpD family protein [Acetobacteraceae bacterium]
MTVAHQIAERIHAFQAADLPPLALEWTNHAFIDTVACSLAGMAEDAPHIVMSIPGVAEAPGPATIWASDRRTNVLDATLVNGTASHALDYDDVAGVMGGHPSAMLVPSMIALGESLGSSGRDLALAYVVGYETECRIARGVHFHHYDKGWHPTATIGIFGTVAGAARLLNLTVDQTAVALGLAASFASGLKANFGTMTKPLHVGHASRNGLFAAYMARNGFTANAGAFEHKQGFLEVFNGPGTYDTGKMLADWYAPLECEGGGEPGLKPYPCCGSTHASVSRMIHLAKTHDIHAGDVETIEVMPHLRRLPHTDNPDPRSPLEAKFSIQYCVARALTDRAVKLDHFENGAENDPAVRALLPRVRAFAHPGLPADGPHQWGAEVVVHTKDGRRLASRVDNYENRGPGGQMMTSDELWTKFSDCAERVLPKSAIAPLFAKLSSVAGMATVTELTTLMRYPNLRSRAA